MNERDAGKMLAGLDKKKREKLRRIVLISTEDENQIAAKVQCAPHHVMAMRARLIAFGVLPKPELVAPRSARATPPRGKYRNGDLFEDVSDA